MNSQISNDAIIIASTFLIGIFSLSFISIIKNENKRKIVVLLIVTILISIMTLSLFNQNLYKSFLGKIRYGGEIPIKIEYRKADNTQSTTEGLLLIRTNQSITLRNTSTNFTEEIPNDRISKMIFENDVKNFSGIIQDSKSSEEVGNNDSK